MCGRYTLLNQKSDYLADRFHLAAAPKHVQANYNVSPGQTMPVIYRDKNGKKQLELMKWGLIPSWSKDPNIGYKLINARTETVFEKPMWRNVILHKRALIPADGFYEWLRSSTAGKVHKQPYYIQPKQTELFTFAGIWEEWHDHDGLPIKTYSILTTGPNKEMLNIHNRMPVILRPEEETAWLKAGEHPTAIEPYLHPYHDDGLEMHKVSERVNSANNNDPSLLKAV